MVLWMLLWVRRIRHAERSGRFRLSPGEVENPRFEAGDGHMPLSSPWGLISNTVSFTSQEGRDLGLSREQLDEPEKVDSLAFPGSLLRALRPELGRREGS